MEPLSVRGPFGAAGSTEVSLEIALSASGTRLGELTVVGPFTNRTQVTAISGNLIWSNLPIGQDLPQFITLSPDGTLIAFFTGYNKSNIASVPAEPVIWLDNNRLQARLYPADPMCKGCAWTSALFDASGNRLDAPAAMSWWHNTRVLNVPGDRLYSSNANEVRFVSNGFLAWESGDNSDSVDTDSPSPILTG